jgi:hypothetical protein
MKWQLPVAIAAVVSSLLAAPNRASAASRLCSIVGNQHVLGVLIAGNCYRQSPRPTSAITKTVFCGRPSSRANALWNPMCGAPVLCPSTLRGRPGAIDAFATLTLINGRWTDPHVWCPTPQRPGIDKAAVRDRAIRLLPGVEIGSAWTTTALVNAETILWAVTAPDRSLASVTVAGQRVQLRVHFAEAHWDYGDGTSETSTSPGKPYDERNDPCRTKQCAHYRGHTYSATGRMRIALTVTWHAQYRASDGSWRDIDGGITGPTRQHVITVKEARAILVPNPGDH